MAEFLENLKIISSFHKASKNTAEVKNRELNAFIVRIKGYADYIFNDRTLRVNEGEMIFIPKGSSYSFVTPPQKENLYTSINFSAENVPFSVKVYPISDFHNVKYITDSFTELWNFGDASDKYKCFSIFYELVSYITKMEHLSDVQKRKHAVIEPAVEYLKKHIYDGELKINKLYALCGVSDTYFRRIFLARFGMTPSEYITAGRLSYAKIIIESNEYATLKEVAELVGYNDPLYFSKAFKKFYGYPPSFSND